MRPLISWMTKVDDVILEWVGGTDVAALRKVVTTNLDTPVSYSQVKRRVQVLHDYGPFHEEFAALGDLISKTVPEAAESLV